MAALWSGWTIDDHRLLEARLAAFHGILEGTRQLLEPNDYARYRADLNRRVREQLLGAPADSLAERGLVTAAAIVPASSQYRRMARRSSRAAQRG